MPTAADDSKFILSFRNLTYDIKVPMKSDPNNPNAKKVRKCCPPKEFKRILSDCSGYVMEGEACFIMGSSGAGKTTLLNALADRLVKGRNNYKFSGSVKINGEFDVKQKNFGNYGAYVMQDDILYSTLSCEQALLFAARLRLGGTTTSKKRRVEEIIHDLGLNGCRRTLIGNDMIKGLSGGERKRTSIGVEMITNPQILFCDEPTSGLDSFNAKKIVDVLISQAKEGRAVISTIHQPSSETYANFDKLILMSEGSIIYQGPAGDAP